LQYAQDYDERFPQTSFAENPDQLAHSNSFGWADALQPYLKNRTLYQCPSEPISKETVAINNASSPQFTDYYINSNAAGKLLKYFNKPHLTLLCGEGNDGTDLTNARYNRNFIPEYWQLHEESPARRHLDGGNYLYADGHVKWLKPEQITTLPIPKIADKFRATFALR
jgi:prepilin-type processing-associated H-X9-DG protein